MSSSAAVAVGVQVGGVYQVDESRDMGTSCASCERCAQVGLRLLGAVPVVAGYRAGFICSGAFRPIYRPKSEIIQGLLTPIDERVEA